MNKIIYVKKGVKPEVSAMANTSVNLRANGYFPLSRNISRYALRALDITEIITYNEYKVWEMHCHARKIVADYKITLDYMLGIYDALTCCLVDYGYPVYFMLSHTFCISEEEAEYIYSMYAEEIKKIRQ